MRRCLLVLACAAGACSPALKHDRSYIEAEIGSRTGIRPPAGRAPGEAPLPEGASIADGLTQEEAV
ncbi:MAG: hypothetical protein ACRD2T_05330, partial [Thermoanaerobaculia bacterium]